MLGAEHEETFTGDTTLSDPSLGRLRAPVGDKAPVQGAGAPAATRTAPRVLSEPAGAPGGEGAGRRGNPTRKDRPRRAAQEKAGFWTLPATLNL
ncbi:hypothetical protein GCM10007079_20680 [Nocardiopsis terrae]|nr:hypothetical protein GCM10007079_20680 [Nocardiopsis terrae]